MGIQYRVLNLPAVISILVCRLECFMMTNKIQACINIGKALALKCLKFLAPPAAASAARDCGSGRAPVGLDWTTSWTSLDGAFEVAREVAVVDCRMAFWSAFVASRCQSAALLATGSVDRESQSVTTSLSCSCLQAAPVEVSSSSRCKAK